MAKKPGGSTHSASLRASTSRPPKARCHVIDHPVVAAGLSILRSKKTAPDLFRRHLQEISVFLFVEASRAWDLRSIPVETPLGPCDGAILARPIVLVPILRAGLGMLDGIQRIAPDAAIGHIGVYRDAETLRPVSYYERVPGNIGVAEVLLLDPMLATGNSACEAAAILKARGARSIQFLSVVASTVGIEQFQRAHPDVPIIAAAIDRELNDHAYIVPGLGDAGDRYFGTG